MAEIILLLIAAILIFLHAWGWVPSRPWSPHFGWLGVFFALLALLVGAIGGTGLGRRADMDFIHHVLPVAQEISAKSEDKMWKSMPGPLPTFPTQLGTFDPTQWTLVCQYFNIADLKALDHK